MQDMDVFIWYDSDGKITAVGTPHPAAGDRVKPVPSAERDVLHLTMEENDRINLKHLHRTHRVDVVKHVLVPLQGS
jgi:hypothetical protein